MQEKELQEPLGSQHWMVLSTARRRGSTWEGELQGWIFYEFLWGWGKMNTCRDWWSCASLRALASCLNINEPFDLSFVSSKPAPWNVGTTMHHEHYLCTSAVADMVLWLWEKTHPLVLLTTVLSCPQVVQTLKEYAAPTSEQEGNLLSHFSAWGELLGGRQCTSRWVVHLSS